MSVTFLCYVLHELLLRTQATIRAHHQPPAWALVKIHPQALHIVTQNMITTMGVTQAGRIRGANQGGGGGQAGVLTDTDIDNDGEGRTHAVLGGVGHDHGHDHGHDPEHDLGPDPGHDLGHDRGRGQGTLRGRSMVIVALTIRAQGQGRCTLFTMEDMVRHQRMDIHLYRRTTMTDKLIKRSANLQTLPHLLENHIRRPHNLPRYHWLQVGLDIVTDTDTITPIVKVKDRR